MITAPRSNPPLDKSEIALVAKCYGRRESAITCARIADRIAALSKGERAHVLMKLTMLAPFALRG
jgi:hypothetical protein